MLTGDGQAVFIHSLSHYTRWRQENCGQFTVTPVIISGVGRAWLSVLYHDAYRREESCRFIFCPIMSAGDRRDVVHCLQELGKMWFTVCRR